MSGAVDVWFAHVDDRVTPDHLRVCEACLSEAERQRAGRFHFERDRRLFVVSHTLVRAALSRRAPVALDAWQFSSNAYGRPEVAGPAGHEPLRFSLSHTEGLAVAAVASAADGVRDLGVDVESLARQPAQPGLAERFFSAAEAAALALEPPDRRHDAFLEVWTLKEAYVKARGQGLGLGLDTFSVTRGAAATDRPSPAGAPADAAASLAPVLTPPLGDDPAEWRLAQFRPTRVHLVGLALHLTGDDVPTISLCETTVDEWFAPGDPRSPPRPHGSRCRGQ